MEIMSTRYSLLLALGLTLTGSAFASDVTLPNVASSHPGASVQVIANGKVQRVVERAMLNGNAGVSYDLARGRTTLLVALSQIENVDTISCLDAGAKGTLTIAVSNAKLPAGSKDWRVVAQEQLAGGEVKRTIGPAEAKYVRMVFELSEPARISGLAISTTAAADLRVGLTESDGKSVADGKDMADAKDLSKEIPAEEPPGEGPPPSLLPPPPFVFVPEIVPTSP
jgi:hypothetical protein